METLQQQMFDTFNEAKEWQREKLQQVLDAGHCIRTAELWCEEDFARKGEGFKWKAMVRSWPEIYEKAK